MIVASWIRTAGADGLAADPPPSVASTLGFEGQADPFGYAPPAGGAAGLITRTALRLALAWQGAHSGALSFVVHRAFARSVTSDGTELAGPHWRADAEPLIVAAGASVSIDLDPEVQLWTQARVDLGPVSLWLALRSEPRAPSGAYRFELREVTP